MKKIRWEISLGVILIISSVILYFSHFLIFHDRHHIFIYLLGDVAFVPIEVLIVTLIIHRLLSEKEKQNTLQKLNMVIGAFFDEVGVELLEYLIEFDDNFEKIRKNLIIEKDWKRKDFLKTKRNLKNYNYGVDSKKGDLESLREILINKRTFLLRLLENPVLLEHQSFTNLLWAVFHFADELSHRKNTKNLPQSDYEHLSGDMERVYIHLIGEWLDYMRYLQKSYPYLFSLALRTNPFDPEAEITVK